LSCLSFESPKSCLIKQLMVLCAISISRSMIFCFWTGFLLILDLTALITCGIRSTRGRLDLLRSLTRPISKKQQYNTQRHAYYLMVLKVRALSILHLWKSNTVLFVCPLHLNGSFIVYMSTVSNVKITFGCVQFLSRKSRIYTCINIYGRTWFLYIFQILGEKSRRQKYLDWTITWISCFKSIFYLLLNRILIYQWLRIIGSVKNERIP
jgi:hypothetical protein